MNPIFVKPILLRRLLSGVAYYHERQRHDAFRELAMLREPSNMLIYRVHPGPYCSQSKRVSRDEKVLCSCRAVLHSEPRKDDVPSVGANKDAEGCASRQARERTECRNIVEHFPVLGDNEFPRLFVRRRRRTHSAARSCCTISSVICSFVYRRTLLRV